MSVILPTGSIAGAKPRFIDRGGVQEAALGGVDQRLDRLGSKWGADFQLVPMKANTASVWISRLILGRREKARIMFPQPGLVPSVTVNTCGLVGDHAANVEQITIDTTFVSQIGLILYEGQFISLTRSGMLYIHQVKNADSVFFAGGRGAEAIVSIHPPLRTSFLDGSSVTVSPSSTLIEGYVKGDDSSWTIDNAKIYGMEFSIEEAQ